MTIIIALKDIENKRIIVGADTQVTTGQLTGTTKDKIIELPLDIVDGYGEIIETRTVHILLCGYLYLSFFLRYGFELPVMNEQQLFIEYLYNNLLPELKALLQEDCLVEIENNVVNTESSLIFIFEGEIYDVSYRFCVTQEETQYSVHGSGSEIALGSLYTNLNYHKDMNYIDMVKQAIKACGNNCIYCNDDVVVKVINY